jgi:hypothetical protein
MCWPPDSFWGVGKSENAAPEATPLYLVALYRPTQYAREGWCRECAGGERRGVEEERVGRRKRREKCGKERRKKE